MGLLTQTEITDRARRICASVEIPIIVDADTGYGNPLNVHRTVRVFDRRGCRGLLPGGPTLAEEVRTHARQAGHRAQE